MLSVQEINSLAKIALQSWDSDFFVMESVVPLGFRADL